MHFWWLYFFRYSIRICSILGYLDTIANFCNIFCIMRKVPGSTAARVSGKPHAAFKFARFLIVILENATVPKSICFIWVSAVSGFVGEGVKCWWTWKLSGGHRNMCTCSYNSKLLIQVWITTFYSTWLNSYILLPDIEKVCVLINCKSKIILIWTRTMIQLFLVSI